ncbi:endo-1,4-beta-glucanase [Ilyonectria robusta]|uniref:endo-1,4-beta-glucanase n=1 Tax=Ilyonectria robusta TaxID=1079257 RepID=UPI001E8D1752|nr:endo-1,4-beta-glucanase [Ilyonectria robusta]KAH8667246.1 endo-1,4-beta-glucanase [Ilyonectria robusta]
MPSSKTLLSMLAGAATVAAHGHVNNIVINGASYAGYDVFTLPYESNPPVVVGWAQDATDNGFIAPSAYGTSDIICHKNAENAKGHATVAAGDSIYLQWDTWPDSHKGPVLDYLAACGDSGCESVEKTTLEFFKIGEKGLIDGSASPGTYAADELIDNGIGWLVQIPESIKPGFYVLRHEIIALHSAGNADGAQNYPQCFNLEITGSGTEVPTGTLGTELYKADDAGILFNIYTSLSTYPIPGPTMIAGATEVEQASSAIASSADPTTGTALATGAGSAVATSAAAVATSAAQPPPQVQAQQEGPRCPRHCSPRRLSIDENPRDSPQ